MQRNEQNLVIPIEFSLSAIAMVDVPVKDANSLSLLPCYLRSYRCIIKNAEACSLPAFRVVPRGPRNAISPLEGLVCKYYLNALHSRQQAEEGPVIALFTHVNIVVLVYKRLVVVEFLAILFYGLNVLVRMIQGEYFLLQVLYDLLRQLPQVNLLHFFKQFLLFQIFVDVQNSVWDFWRIVDEIRVLFAGHGLVEVNHTPVVNIESLFLVSPLHT